MTACVFVPDTRMVVAGDDGGHVYILRLLESASLAAGMVEA